MKKSVLTICLLCVASTGCETLRFAPSEVQKQNAWLHNRTAAATSITAKEQGTSQQLQTLTQLGEKQSRAFVSYFGLPEDLPQAETADGILSQANVELAETAITESELRPDGWELADAAIEFGIGISALLGGVYGTRAVRFFGQAREKSKALQEIIAGNELFKKQNASSVEAFKFAQSDQSPSTRKIVAELKA
jgi:hypothetical protein